MTLNMNTDAALAVSFVGIVIAVCGALAIGGVASKNADRDVKVSCNELKKAAIERGVNAVMCS